MKAGEIYVQTRTIPELRYATENMVVIHNIVKGKVSFSRIKPIAYCNNSAVLDVADFKHLFQFYF